MEIKDMAILPCIEGRVFLLKIRNYDLQINFFYLTISQKVF